MEKTLGVRIELPSGLGLTEKDVMGLVDRWIVPELIRLFVQESGPKKKPVQSESFEALKPLPLVGKGLDRGDRLDGFTAPDPTSSDKEKTA